jgi:hypothetical protein
MMNRYKPDTGNTVSTSKNKLLKVMNRAWQLACLFLFMFVFTAVSYAQITISGTVTSVADGGSLPGITVLEKAPLTVHLLMLTGITRLQFRILTQYSFLVQSVFKPGKL